MEVLFGSLTYDEVLRFLEETDQVFQVPLSSKLDLRQYARKLSTHSLFAYVKDDDEMVGMISCYMNRPPSGYISNVCVKPECQGQGLFHRMFRRIAEEATTRGIKTLTLEADDFNTAARRLYSKVGFHCVGQASEHSDYFEYRVASSDPTNTQHENDLPS